MMPYQKEKISNENSNAEQNIFLNEFSILFENMNLEDVSNFLIKYPNFINKQENKSGLTLLQKAVIEEINDIAEFLLSINANPDFPNILSETPLYNAVENSNYKIINLLLEAGADPNIQNKVSLLLC